MRWSSWPAAADSQPSSRPTCGVTVASSVCSCVGGEGVEGGCEQHVDQRREGAAGGGCCRGHTRNLSATSDSSARRKRLWTRRRRCGQTVRTVGPECPSRSRSPRRQPGDACVMRSGTSRRVRGMTQRRSAGPAHALHPHGLGLGTSCERPPPPRTPQDATAPSPGRPAERPPPPRTPQDASSRPPRDVLRRGHLRRARRRTQAPTTSGRPATWPPPPPTPEDAGTWRRVTARPGRFQPHLVRDRARSGRRRRPHLPQDGRGGPPARPRSRGSRAARRRRGARRRPRRGRSCGGSTAGRCGPA